LFKFAQCPAQAHDFLLHGQPLAGRRRDPVPMQHVGVMLQRGAHGHRLVAIERQL
jgi:hypothetical protein